MADERTLELLVCERAREDDDSWRKLIAYPVDRIVDMEADLGCFIINRDAEDHAVVPVDVIDVHPANV